MEWVLSISFGELTLKGDNRQAFFQRAIRNIRQAI
jgi:adenylyl- and sulfurtransferase ThiI